MQTKLIIYLHHHELEEPSWVYLDVDGKIQQTVIRGNGMDLAEFAAHSEVIVFVPGEQIVLTRVQLPKMSRARIFQALPYAIEEELMTDIETLHFAIGDQDANGFLPVAIVARAEMERWLALVKAWSVEATAFFPMTMAIPYLESGWCLLADKIALVRMNKTTGFACDLDNLPTMLSFALSNQTELPATISMQNLTEQSIAQTLPFIQPISETFISREDFLNHSAQGVNESAALNLLQGGYAIKKSKGHYDARFKRFAIYLSALLISLFFIGPMISYFILNQRVKNIDAAIATIYKANFPESKSVVAPKLRMQEKLQRLSAQPSENQLLSLLGHVSEGIHLNKSIKLKRLDFQNDQLTLALSATSDEFSNFSDFLRRQGLKVKQQNADLSGSEIDATLLIE